MNKAYYLFKIILTQDQNILIQDIQIAMSKINGKAFHHSRVFSLITKETEKKTLC